MAVKRLAKEEGSISILTFGLFAVAIALLIVLTDLGAIAVAKQSLTHVAESAAIRAVHNLDLPSYYRGESGVSVPIDCSTAYRLVSDELNAWQESQSDMKRPEVREVWLSNFNCAGDRVSLKVMGRAALPFRLPQGATFVEIASTVEAHSQRVS